MTNAQAELLAEIEPVTAAVTDRRERHSILSALAQGLKVAAEHETQSPRVATDCIIIDEAGNLVLVRRRNEPFKGRYALPGGFVDAGETVEDACRREVKEETNLEIHDMRLVGVYSQPGRDPRGHVVSVVFRARADLAQLKAGDDAAQVEVMENWRDRSLAFDHRQMIEDSLKAPELKGGDG